MKIVNESQYHEIIKDGKFKDSKFYRNDGLYTEEERENLYGGLLLLGANVLGVYSNDGKWEAVVPSEEYLKAREEYREEYLKAQEEHNRIQDEEKTMVKEYLNKLR